MGGRGARSASGSIAAVPVLDFHLVQRANGASALGNAGDIISRAYKRNVAEINGTQLSKSEKSAAIGEQKRLSESALRTTANNPSVYTTGRARTGNAESSRRGDAIAKANAAVDSHMRQVRRDAEKASRQRAKERRAAAVKKALDSGALSFTLDGVTYARKTRRSRSFISVS